MIGSSKAKSQGGLERAISKYEAKLAKAANPTQRNYASSMLSMARQALAKSQDGDPLVEPDGADVVDLHKDEYQAR